MRRMKSINLLSVIALFCTILIFPVFLPAQAKKIASGSDTAERTYIVQVRQMHRVSGKPADIVRSMQVKTHIGQDFQLSAEGKNWDWSGDGKLTKRDKDIYLELDLTLNEYAETKLDDGTSTRTVENKLTQSILKKIHLSNDLAIGQYRPADSKTGKTGTPDLIVANVRPDLPKSYSATELHDKMRENELFARERDNENKTISPEAARASRPKLFKAWIRFEWEEGGSDLLLVPDKKEEKKEKKVYKLERVFRDGANDVFDVRDKLMSINAEIVVTAAGDDQVHIDLEAKHRGTKKLKIGEPMIGAPKTGEPKIGEPKIGEPKIGELPAGINPLENTFKKEMTLDLGKDTEIGDIGDVKLFMKLEKFNYQP